MLVGCVNSVWVKVQVSGQSLKLFVKQEKVSIKLSEEKGFFSYNEMNEYVVLWIFLSMCNYGVLPVVLLLPFLL